jgi:transposase
MSRSLILGVDPAKRKFTACLMDSQGDLLMASADFAMARGGFDALLAGLRPHRLNGGRLVVGIEASAALDDNLMEFFASEQAREDGELCLLRLDAGQVARFSGPRPIRGKTDKTDARRIAQFARAYAARLAAFQADPQAQAMTRLINEREQLVKDNTALKNRLQDRLVVSFPEFEQVFEKPCSELALMVLRQVQTAAGCARKRAATLAGLRARKGGHAVGPKRAQRLVELAKRSIASATAPSDGQTVDYFCARLQLNAGRIAQIEAQIQAYAQSDRTQALTQPTQDQITLAPAACAQPQPESTPSAIAAPALGPPQAPPPPDLPAQIRLADTMPGIGVTGAATLVLRCRDLTRFSSAKALAAQLGTCPDRVQTGSSQDRAALTYRGDRRTRSTLYLLTLSACQSDPAMAFHRWRHRRQGHTRKQAICACMNRQARILWSVVNDQTPYDLIKAITNAKIHHPQLWITFLQEVLPKLKNMGKEPKKIAKAA